MEQRHIDNGTGIFLIWLNWVVGVGAIVLTIVLSLWVKATAMPLVAFGLELMLFAMLKKNRQARVPVCFVIPFVIMRALFWSGVIMVIINILYSDWFVERLFDLGTINRQIPFIAQLILAPVTMAISFWAYRKKGALGFCRECKMRYGTPAERGFLGKLFTQEGRYQVRFLLIVSVTSTVLTWSYYFASYININLNNADKFFFVWMTALVYVATVIYLGIRYLGLWSYYCHSENTNTYRHGATTKLRFIMIWDNFICLQDPATDADTLMPEEDKTDIPAKITLTYRHDVSLYDASRNFEAITGLQGVDTRFMYSTVSANADCNIFHYLCFLDEEQKHKFDATSIRCAWYKFGEVADMLNKHTLAPLLSSEMVRLHTVAMAWKTYTPEGKRRYKIKNYKPTFRIKDIHKYNVDYNDPTWLFVSDNNEDVPFFKLRRFWRRHINGAI
ncbi:MAG: hypothetical protein NC043_08530 [Muribaculaceae bacterium]|nr:hypothetical protein [Muribaculaceae bacterium]